MPAPALSSPRIDQAAEATRPEPARSHDAGGGGKSFARRGQTALLVGLGLLLAAGGGVALVRRLQAPPAPRFVVEPVRRGDLEVAVSANGVLQPVNKVDVGSEISGRVDEVHVDDNDRVRRGEVLARLNTALLQDQILRAEATLATARSKVAFAEAALKQAEVQASRLHGLFEASRGDAPARMELDAADAARDKARADLLGAKAAVQDAAAALHSNRTNLSKASILSPIDGVVLNRNVDPGQTVAATLQAPVLFTLAQDLRRMQIDVDIDEADVARVREGQAATFTVDAYQGRTFPARLSRIGFGSQLKDNVVTYTGVLQIDNGDLSLRPGMTATAQITTERRSGVLLAPNAALRFTPSQPPKAANNRGGGGLLGAILPRMPRIGPGGRRSGGSAQQVVWILKDGEPSALKVVAGLTDGSSTEISGPEIREGLQLITDNAAAAR